MGRDYAIPKTSKHICPKCGCLMTQAGEPDPSRMGYLETPVPGVLDILLIFVMTLIMIGLGIAIIKLGMM